jgi:CelD/BcsL family acetyltransferase involved in cellulose biosynthesis
MTAIPPVINEVEATARGSASVSVFLVEADPLTLREHLAAWEKLAANALEPNVFYEPWTLLPAVEHIRNGAEVRLLLVFGPPGSAGAAPLWGLFPLEVQSHCLHLPVRTLAFWQHRYCYLTVPLIHRDHAEEVIDAFWRWFERNPLGCRVLDTNYLPSDAGFHGRWADALIGRYLLVLNEHPRGLQTRAPSFESYVSSQLSRKRYQAICRGQRRLEELGASVFRQIESSADVDSWVEQFLQLESQGWKGREGGAMANTAEDAHYFRKLVCAGFVQNRARLLSLDLNGRQIAMKLVLTCEDGGYSFKIAYDESFAKYSPGVILELEDLRSWHAGGKINWIDSCASPRHPLFDLISNERRAIRRTLISDGSRLGDLFLSALPLLRWLRHRLSPHATAHHLRVITQGGKAA